MKQGELIATSAQCYLHAISNVASLLFIEPRCLVTAMHSYVPLCFVPVTFLICSDPFESLNPSLLSLCMKDPLNFQKYIISLPVALALQWKVAFFLVTATMLFGSLTKKRGPEIIQNVLITKICFYPKCLNQIYKIHGFDHPMFTISKDVWQL